MLVGDSSNNVENKHDSSGITSKSQFEAREMLEEEDDDDEDA
jgi:hypothetical protein